MFADIELDALSHRRTRRRSRSTWSTRDDIGSCTQPAALAGYPLLTVPVALAHGLPVAVSFWGSVAARRP